MSEITCPDCGAVLSAATKFCRVCGAKIVLPEPESESVITALNHPQYQTHQPVVQTAQTQQPGPQFTQEAPANDSSSAYAQVPDNKTVGAAGYFFMLLAFSIPILGFILAFLWAFGKKTPRTRKAVALAQLVLWGIFLAGILVFYILNFKALNELIKVILS